MLGSVSLNHMLKSHYTVGTEHYITKLEVDLVLPLGHFVVGSLNGVAHILQGQANIPTAVLAVVDGVQVKVTALVAGLQGGVAVLIQLKQEELALRANIKAKAHLGSLVHHLLQHIAGVAHEGGLIIGFIYGADQSSGLRILVLSPGEDGPSVVIRVQIHIGLINANKAVDGRTVKHTVIVQRLLQLGQGDGHILHNAEHIRKLQADKLYIIFLCAFDDVFLCVFTHSKYSSLKK